MRSAGNSSVSLALGDGTEEDVLGKVSVAGSLEHLMRSTHHVLERPALGFWQEECKTEGDHVDRSEEEELRETDQFSMMSVNDYQTHDTTVRELENHERSSFGDSAEVLVSESLSVERVNLQVPRPLSSRSHTETQVSGPVVEDLRADDPRQWANGETVWHHEQVAEWRLSVRARLHRCQCPLTS